MSHSSLRRIASACSAAVLLTTAVAVGTLRSASADDLDTAAFARGYELGLQASPAQAGHRRRLAL